MATIENAQSTTTSKVATKHEVAEHKNNNAAMASRKRERSDSR